MKKTNISIAISSLTVLSSLTIFITVFTKSIINYSAQAKGLEVTFPKNLSLDREEQNKRFFELRKTTPHAQQFFIPVNTLRCGKKESLKEMYREAVNGGGTVRIAMLNRYNCGLGNGRWSVGLLAEDKDPKSDIVLLIYETRPMQSGYAYFYLPSLMTIEQRKKMEIQ